MGLIMVKNLKCLFFIVGIFSAALLRADIPAYCDSNVVETLVNDNTAFALDLYRHLKKDDDNIFLSPYSISTVLAMTYAGAEGNTANQISEVLDFTLGQEQLRSAFGELQTQLAAIQKTGNVELNTANALWTQRDYPFLDDFFKLAASSYRAELKSVDFKTAYEAVRKEINAWVENQTRDKIKDLIKPGVIDSLTRLVLVNAIYFKGMWASQFKKSATTNSDFWLTKEKPLNVPMMSQQQEYNYMENDDLQILELPYAGNDVSMIVLLPKKIDNLAKLANSLAAKTLKSWLIRLRKRKIIVYLPRFNIISQFNLAQTLKSMGLIDAFKPQMADFSGIDGTRNLHISAVVHKAFVDVNEEGTEAAAATGAVVSVTSLPESQPVFRADHPFIFLIRENKFGSLLFIGRLVDPTK